MGTMELSGKKVVVVGLGRSGIAAARLCRARGAEVMVTDSRPRDALSEEARALDARFIPGGHEFVPVDEVELMVVSPGVAHLALFDEAESKGVEVIGELELAARILDAPIVAIGGTNGKSTVTTAVGGMLGGGGRAFVGGNLGTPLSEAVGLDIDVAVVEVSSFQVERAPSFQPRVAALLNVSEDHLDRYPSFLAYAEAKGNMFVNQVAGDVAVIPEGDSVCAEQAARGQGRRVSFGAGGDYVVEGRRVVERTTGAVIDIGDAEFHGAHNLANAAAAVAVARAFGASEAAVQAGVVSFRALPHRMAPVGEFRGVRYYDDSKATNVGAAVTALIGLSEPRAILIAGGRDKLGSYEPLVRAMRERGRALVAIGEAGPRIAAAMGDAVPVIVAESMETAVREAARRAEPGDAVLLSPACSSFDWFSSYAERGDRFAEAVRSMQAEGSAS